MSKASLIDTHCHLDFPEFDQDRDETVKRSLDEGIEFIVNIGSSLKGSRDSLRLAEKFAFIYAAVGLHPHEAGNFNDKINTELTELAKGKKVVAIGETGFDFYRNYSAAVNQKKLFVFLLELAKSLKLPVVIHNRQAEKDTLEILKRHLPIKAVVHCFSGDKSFLHECLSLGFFISFTCNITYRKAESLREIVKLTPLKRLMLETDAPFLPPEGMRGKRNEPCFIKKLAEEIARIKGISFEEVALATSATAKEFFNLS